MIQKLLQSHDNVIGYSVRGKLTEQDYHALNADLQTLTDKYDDVRMLVKLEDLSGFDLNALDDDLRMAKYSDDIDRYAVVGDNRLYNAMASVADKFMDMEIRHFSLDDEQAAWTWLRAE